MPIVISAEIEAVIQEFEHASDPFTVLDVQQALGKARRDLEQPSEADFGAWTEILAFALTDATSYAGPSPWGTFFCPLASTEDKEGKTRYFPDISGANADVIDHWSRRARTITHPVLKARYADLVWDLSPLVSGARRNPEMARLAIDAYHGSLPAKVLNDFHDRFTAALRALDLALLIGDAERVEVARADLLRLHREVMDVGQGPWWFAFDRLMTEKNAGLTEEERQQLVDDLEQIVAARGDTSKPERFDPHVAQDAAKRLIKLYTRLRRPDDVKRLNEAIARAFEHFAGLGNAMLASAVLQTAVNAYRDAGMPDESKRVRVLMEEKIGRARGEMGAIQTEIRISTEDMEKFLGEVLADELGTTFVRIAANFLPTRRRVEAAVQKTVEQAPLMALMPQHIMADDHVAGKVGSVLDDPQGRLLQQTTMDFGLSAIWLQSALERTIERHQAMPEHFVAWANRLGLFDDVTFLLEGVRAWYEGDLTKALHVLVPQIERGLRNIVAQIGLPVTKPHPTIADVGVAITMGDILYRAEITEALGPDLTLHFLALFADPRGFNLRNQVAHGQVDDVTSSVVEMLILTLLIFGAWREFAERRR